MCMFLHYTPATRGYGCIHPAIKQLHCRHKADKKGRTFSTPYTHRPVDKSGWIFARYFSWQELRLDMELASHAVHAFTSRPQDAASRAGCYKAYAIGVLGWGNYYLSRATTQTPHICSMAMFVPLACHDQHERLETQERLERILRMPEGDRFDALLDATPLRAQDILDTHYRDIQW